MTYSFTLEQTISRVYSKSNNCHNKCNKNNKKKHIIYKHKVKVTQTREIFCLFLTVYKENSYICK